MPVFVLLTICAVGAGTIGLAETSENSSADPGRLAATGTGTCGTAGAPDRWRTGPADLVMRNRQQVPVPLHS